MCKPLTGVRVPSLTPTARAFRRSMRLKDNPLYAWRNDRTRIGDMTEVDTTVVAHRSGVRVSTLPQAFQETAALEPDAVAIRTVGDKEVITWRQYADRV